MASPEEIAELFARVGRAYKLFMEAELSGAGTTPARARLLAALMCAGQGKMNDLSRHLNVTPRNITKLVDGLEAEGLVRREAHPEDRRATLVTLTPEGMHAAKESFLKSSAARQLFGELTERDREDLARVLGRLLDMLRGRGAVAPG